jgi:chemotaxis protein CheC
MGFYQNLDQYAKDLLKELCTIGTGNAATSLSAILKEPINIEVPALKIITPEKLPESLGGAELSRIVVFSYLSGQYPSKFLIIFSENEAKKIVNLLLHKDITGNINFNEETQLMPKSALLEIGNIIISAYVSAVGTILRTILIQSPPQIKFDILGSIIDEFCIESAETNSEILLLKNKFIEEKKEILFDIIFIPNENSITSILNTIKGKS